jgi:hypothetical protein
MFWSKKIEIEILGSDGKPKKVKVSKREFERWQAKGKVQKISCSVHVLDPMSPLRVETWIIGEDVDEDTYNKFKDENGDLYLSIHYRDGAPTKHLMQRAIWTGVKRQFDQIGGV